MNDEMRELGRRAIAADFGYPPGSVWRDTDGRKYACMRSNGEGRAIMQPMDGGWSQCVSAPDSEWMIPDLSDPATLGCLEHQVRERFGGRVAFLIGQGWHTIETPACGYSASGYKPDDAAEYVAGSLVRALEAAPKAAP